MKTMKLFLASLLIMGAITSCKKVEGPKGDKGDTGAMGAQGNANVISSSEGTITASNWTQSGTQWYCTMNLLAITQNIVDKGLVQVFVKYGNEWWALPDQNGINQTSFGFAVGTVTLMNQNVNGTTPANPGNMTTRVVVISPSQLSENPNTDWTDYQQVKQALNL